MVHFGVVLPLALLFPIEWMIYGPRAILGFAVALMAGLVLVELQMDEWRRIPFTCSYMPGKRFVGLTLLIGFASFVAFTSIGSLLLWISRAHPLAALVFLALLGSVVWERRRRRIRLTRHTPLMFEDALPTEVEPLQLSFIERDQKKPQSSQSSLRKSTFFYVATSGGFAVNSMNSP